MMRTLVLVDKNEDTKKYRKLHPAKWFAIRKLGKFLRSLREEGDRHEIIFTDNLDDVPEKRADRD